MKIFSARSFAIIQQYLLGDLEALNALVGYSRPAGATVAPQLNPADVAYAVRSGAADAVLSVLLS